MFEITLGNTLTILAILGSAGTGLLLAGRWIGKITQALESIVALLKDHETRIRELEGAE